MLYCPGDDFAICISCYCAEFQFRESGIPGQLWMKFKLVLGACDLRCCDDLWDFYLVDYTARQVAPS